ncbi:effector-associated constant component EACC1 [Amycolatopsis sp. lyj-346]|uniref:effector-associated constant component EACC1 n=1 Tax=Amycolatopsis sp. lyj-346 TaxID=2789289 RepID=UPI00397816DD
MTAGIVAITVPNSAGELPELAAWLRGEDELRGRVQVFDAVVVGVSSSSADVFCRSLFAWLMRCREARVSLKVKRSGAAEELELDFGAASNADQVLVAVQGFLDKS